MDVNEIINSAYASYWLKDAIAYSLERDPVDALKDIQILEKVIKDKLAEMV